MWNKEKPLDLEAATNKYLALSTKGVTVIDSTYFLSQITRGDSLCSYVTFWNKSGKSPSGGAVK